MVEGCPSIFNDWYTRKQLTLKEEVLSDQISDTFFLASFVLVLFRTLKSKDGSCALSATSVLSHSRLALRNGINHLTPKAHTDALRPAPGCFNLVKGVSNSPLISC